MIKNDASTRRARWLRIAFALSGIIGILASMGAPVLLPYPLFVLAVLRGWRLAGVVNFYPAELPGAGIGCMAR